MPLNGLKMPFNFSSGARLRALVSISICLTTPIHAQTSRGDTPERRAQPSQASLLIQSSPLAGSQFHALPEVVDRIRVGDLLTLKREPDNPHDRNAIQVFWQGHMLGFVPRRENKAIARAMDRNQPLIARVVALRPEESPWRRLRFDISMPLDESPATPKSGTQSTR